MTTVAAGSSSPHGILGHLIHNIEQSGRNPTRVLIGFVLAWVMFALIMWVFPRPDGLSPAGMKVLAIVVWASIIWVSEALPVGITGISVSTLLILTQALPWDKGRPPMATVFSGFTGHVVWLCLFAFFVGAIMQLLKLDRRIALAILGKVMASNVGRVIRGLFRREHPARMLDTRGQCPRRHSAAHRQRRDQPARRFAGRAGSQEGDRHPVPGLRDDAPSRPHARRGADFAWHPGTNLQQGEAREMNTMADLKKAAAQRTFTEKEIRKKLGDYSAPEGLYDKTKAMNGHSRRR